MFCNLAIVFSNKSKLLKLKLKKYRISQIICSVAHKQIPDVEPILTRCNQNGEKCLDDKDLLK